MRDCCLHFARASNFTLQNKCFFLQLEEEKGKRKNSEGNKHMSEINFFPVFHMIFFSTRGFKNGFDSPARGNKIHFMTQYQENKFILRVQNLMPEQKFFSTKWVKKSFLCKINVFSYWRVIKWILLPSVGQTKHLAWWTPRPNFDLIFLFNIFFFKNFFYTSESTFFDRKGCILFLKVQSKFRIFFISINAIF